MKELWELTKEELAELINRHIRAALESNIPLYYTYSHPAPVKCVTIKQEVVK